VTARRRRTANRNKPESADNGESLQKIVAVLLWVAGASQDTIARNLSRRKVWVNRLLRGVPKPSKRSR